MAQLGICLRPMATLAEHPLSHSVFLRIERGIAANPIVRAFQIHAGEVAEEAIEAT